MRHTRTKLKLSIPAVEPDRSEDVARIVKVFYDFWYDISDEDAHEAWARHSSMYDTDWLELPESDRYLYAEIEGMFEESY